MQYQELYGIFPFNLAVDLFGGPEDAMKIFLPGLDKALETLTEREQSVLHSRYAEGKTLRECGERIGVRAERARQIIYYAFRKLRHPSRSRLILAVPREEVSDLNREYEELNQKYEQLKAAFESCTQKQAVPENVDPLAKLTLVRKTKILDLDLSERSRHCLIWSGLNTLGDVADMTEQKLMRVRNIGKVSAAEIVACVNTHGLSMKEME